MPTAEIMTVYKFIIDPCIEKMLRAQMEVLKAVLSNLPGVDL